MKTVEERLTALEVEVQRLLAPMINRVAERAGWYAYRFVLSISSIDGAIDDSVLEA